MPTNPFDSFMAQPGQPKKEVSPSPLINAQAPSGPPGVATGPVGRPTTQGAVGPVAPTPQATAQPKPAAQPTGGVTIQVGQPQAPTTPQEQPQEAPPTPAPDAPSLVDPKTGQVRQVATAEDRAEYGRQMAARRAKYGATPFDGDPNAPKPIIRPGKIAYNPFTGSYSK